LQLESPGASITLNLTQVSGARDGEVVISDGYVHEDKLLFLLPFASQLSDTHSDFVSRVIRELVSKVSAVSLHDDVVEEEVERHAARGDELREQAAAAMVNGECRVAMSLLEESERARRQNAASDSAMQGLWRLYLARRCVGVKLHISEECPDWPPQVADVLWEDVAQKLGTKSKAQSSPAWPFWYTAFGVDVSSGGRCTKFQLRRGLAKATEEMATMERYAKTNDQLGCLYHKRVLLAAGFDNMNSAPCLQRRRREGR